MQVAWSWDVSKDATRGAKFVAGALRALIGDCANLDILDAGCGTGLVGSFVVDRARRMDGVDLSPAMLEKARKKRIYDNLYEGDLVAFFRSRPSDYDVITAAGTLNHFADLLSVFNAATVALRDGGLFIFTVFSNEHQGEVTVHPTAAGCFAHGHNCVVRTAEAAGFTIKSIKSEVQEYHYGKPRMGLVVALRYGT